MYFSSDQEKVPVAKIDRIPKEKVDVLKVRDSSKLTSEQLLYNKNLNKFFNKFSDTKKLDEAVVNDVLSQFSKNSVLLQSSDSGTKVTLNNDGSISFTKGNTLSIGDNINTIGIAGFTGARYDGKTLTAQSGSWATQKKNDLTKHQPCKAIKSSVVSFSPRAIFSSTLCFFSSIFLSCS